VLRRGGVWISLSTVVDDNVVLSLVRSAGVDVGVLTTLLLDRLGKDAVLVSLAWPESGEEVSL
jgi:hypothetical protein